MWDHDSIQFALGVERFNLAAHHPHPPGYPLYIALLRLLTRLGIDSLDGMVALAILASALGAGLMVPLVGRLVAEREMAAASGEMPRHALAAGLFAAAVYAFNPLLWFYSELPLLYAVEGGLSVLLAWSALRLGDSARAFYLGCALLALVGGFRPTTMVLLGPLFLWGCVRAARARRLAPTRFVGGLLLGVLLTLAWFVPLCAAAGGFTAYRRINSEHFRTLLPATSVLYGAGMGALLHNLEILLKWALQGMFPAGLMVAGLWVTAPQSVAQGLRQLRSQLPFLLWWAAPPIAFFALFHITKAGYTLIHLPALLAALALAAAPALSTATDAAAAERPGGRRRAIAAIALVAALGGTLYLFGADREPRQSRLWALVRNEFNRGALTTYEHDLDALLALLRRYPSETTVLATVELSGTGAASAEGFLYPWQRHLQWYLPRYPVLWLAPEQGLAFSTQGHRPFSSPESIVPVPPGTRHVVVVLSGAGSERLRLPPGTRIGSTFYVVDVPFRGALRIGPLLLVAKQTEAAA
jgi:hypothetical protein